MVPTTKPASSILFVTGRLAENSLRQVLAEISARTGICCEVAVPGVQVAALLHSDLLLKRLHVPPHIDRVIVPGWCQGDLNLLSRHFGKPFDRGPKDLRDLPEYFGLGGRRQVILDQYATEIIAEINHATRQAVEDVLLAARTMADSGADVIDVGCIPGESSPAAVGQLVRALRGEGLRVSIDSFDRPEVEAAVDAGAELILSCSHANVDWVTQSGVEVVAIPDSPADIQSLRQLVVRLREQNIRFRIDPVIEPIGMGFTASLERYILIRREFPDDAMMMGVGNITELTEVDSAGINMLLAAVCEELKIHSVLTTQVINWCRTAVAEFDVARRLAYYAVNSQVVPKHITSELLMLRDPRWMERTTESLQQLAAALTDANFRIFAEQGRLHLMNRDGYWHSRDPFAVFSAAQQAGNKGLTASHAFYLGYELARAELALQLGKRYEQDDALRWGLLSRQSEGSQSEASLSDHRHHFRSASASNADESDSS